MHFRFTYYTREEAEIVFPFEKFDRSIHSVINNVTNNTITVLYDNGRSEIRKSVVTLDQLEILKKDELLEYVGYPEEQHFLNI